MVQHGLKETTSPLRGLICMSYFGFVEELSEAASRILLRVRGHLQDELHDHSLVRHLLHQCFFLQDTKHKHF